MLYIERLCQKDLAQIYSHRQLFKISSWVKKFLVWNAASYGYPIDAAPQTNLTSQLVCKNSDIDGSTIAVDNFVYPVFSKKLGCTDGKLFQLLGSLILPSLIESDKMLTPQSTQGKITIPSWDRLIEYVPTRDKRQNYHSLGVTQDITVCFQPEDNSQQQWLQYLLNLIPTPLVLIEPATARVIFANLAADKMAGGKFPLAASRAEYDQLYHLSDLRGKAIAHDQMPGIRVAAGEKLDGVEINWHTPFGIRCLLVFSDTLQMIQQSQYSYVVTFQDITDRKQIELAQSLNYNRLQILSSTASELLSSQHPVALVESLYRKISQLIGLDLYFNYLVKEDLEIMQLASCSGISQKLATRMKWLKFGEGICGVVAQERRAIGVEKVLESTDPKTKLLRSIGVNAYYSYPLIARGKLLGTLSFGSRHRSKFTDNEISMLQAICDQIAVAMERADLIASLQQQTEQLQEANRVKNEFLGILSHELRSPLNAILGWSQFLRMGKLDAAKTNKALETIERNAQSQKQLIDNLLDVSRCNKGKLPLNVQTCDLIPIVKTVLNNVKLAAQAKQINLSFTIEDNDVGDYFRSDQWHKNLQFSVLGDSERLGQIVWNLVSNAIKFTDSGGSVKVCLLVKDCGNKIPHPKCAQIEVRDTGIGIEAELLPFVFDYFRQADSSNTRVYSGAGLGLAIVRHIVELHGGCVRAESLGKGLGATFIVKLPLKTIHSPKTSKITSLAAPVSPSLNGVRVLVVDDEADVREFVATVLEQSQAEVKTVASAPAAMDTIIQWQPDVLVSDIAMPSEDGYSLIRKVRSHRATRNIPAAALTAYARAEDRMLAIQSGFQLHLPKPIEPAELTTVVASLARRT